MLGSAFYRARIGWVGLGGGVIEWNNKGGAVWQLQFKQGLDEV